MIFLCVLGCLTALVLAIAQRNARRLESCSVCWPTTEKRACFPLLNSEAATGTCQSEHSTSHHSFHAAKHVLLMYWEALTTFECTVVYFLTFLLPSTPPLLTGNMPTLAHWTRAKPNQNHRACFTGMFICIYHQLRPLPPRTN
jgi:hypothetical protein